MNGKQHKGGGQNPRQGQGPRPNQGQRGGPPQGQGQRPQGPAPRPPRLPEDRAPQVNLPRAGDFMNPFDFVPWFGKGALVNAWKQELHEHQHEPLHSGRITLGLKTLTHLHVAGVIQARPNRQMDRRTLYRQGPDNAPCVPASSVKGAIRSFVEALTNGWFSAITELHERKQDERTYPIRIVDWDKPEGTVLPMGFWVPLESRKKEGEEPRLDIASFLFGIVPQGKASKEDLNQAVAGRVTFEDIFFEEAAKGDVTSLDIDDKAAFGGPKPRLNTFWYFTPDGFEVVRKTMRNGGTVDVLEPQGKWLRGRKFYFHQDPEQCIAWYMENWKHYSTRARDFLPLGKVQTEVVKVGETSRDFQVTFKDLPTSLLRILLLALCPPQGVRHKLGALKPFGFGSVAFTLKNLELDPKGEDLLGLGGSQILTPEQAQPWHSEQALDSLKKAGLVHPDAWDWLRYLQTCPDNLAQKKHRLFLYPPFRQKETRDNAEKGFAMVLAKQALGKSAAIKSVLPVHLLAVGNFIGKRESVELLVDRAFQDEATGKQPIDLSHYQTHADNFGQVCNDGGPTAAQVTAMQKKANWR